MARRCFFHGWPEAGPCNGRLIRAHLIPQQLIKRTCPDGLYRYGDVWLPPARVRELEAPSLDMSGFPWRSCSALLMDPRSWVWCCGGPTGAQGHHGMLDYSRTIRIPRDRLPAGVEEFAAELGLLWWVDRTYPGTYPI